MRSEILEESEFLMYKWDQYKNRAMKFQNTQILETLIFYTLFFECYFFNHIIGTHVNTFSELT